MPGAIDPVALARDLVRCPSVTPEEGGAIALLEATLKPLGFACHRLRFEDEGTPAIENLYARIGEGQPIFCFAGHTDVVPPGPREGWTVDPFGGEVVDGHLYGRGAADMKGGIAAFCAAAADFLAARPGGFPGGIALLITGDEEGPAINGTRKVLDWLAERGERLSACVVGEPTSARELGDMVKIGRRGSMNTLLTVHGTQGHAAYPHLADNPLPRLVRMLGPLTEKDGALDEGTPHFQPSTLALTSIDVGNPATNVIPGRATARFNIRFNDRHSSQSLQRRLEETFSTVGGEYETRYEVSGEAFLTEPGPLSDLVAGAIRLVTGRETELSTTGGTSDARFIARHCPVVEFGLVGRTMHKADERASIDDIRALRDIYRTVLDGFFGG